MSKQPKKKAAAGATPPAPAVEPIVMRPKPDNFKAKLAEGATSILNNGKIYEFQMDARDFKPPDVQLTIKEKSVAIDAHHETEEEETEISFEIEIPVGVDRACIVAHMNRHGVLKISAPITLALPVAEAKTVIVRSEHKTETVAKKVVTSTVVEEIVETHYWEVDPPSLDPKFEDVSNCIVRTDSGEGFKLNLDLPPGTNKDDVHVNVYKTLATVEVKPKEEEKGQPGKLQVEICKKVQLPKQTRNKTLTSVMDVQNGRFTITGLLKTPQQKKPERTEPDKVFEIKKIPAPPKKQAPEAKVGDQLPVVVDSETNLDPEEARAAEDVTDNVMKEFKLDGNNNKFETKVDISGWKPNEVEVKALKKVVTVRAQRTETSETLFKLFKIPPRVRHEDLEAMCASANQLKISSVLQPLCSITPKIDGSSQTSVTKSAAGGAAVEFKHVLDLTGYAPEQIEITIKNGWIAIKAKQVSGVRDFMHSFQARQYSRKFTIPPGVDPSDIKCQLDPLTNTLFITAAGAK